MRHLLVILHTIGAVCATKLLDRNLAYSSPFIGYPEVSIAPDTFPPVVVAQQYSQFARDTKEIQKRHIQHAKRQTVDSSGFVDEHYPTFYGGDFSNVSLPVVHTHPFDYLYPTDSVSLERWH